MSVFEISNEAIAQELSDFQNKLASGAANLAVMKELPSGVTAHDVVFERDKLRLLRYRGSPTHKQNDKRNKTPLLIVYSLINRYYMTDLSDRRSMVKGLLKAGQDVYLIDWGYPDAGDRFTTLGDYLNGAIDACVDDICDRHSIAKINMLGICQGGTLSLCYGALHAAKIRNLVTIVTPVDFHVPDFMLSHWAKNIDADQLVDTLGNIPGAMLSALFLSLKPYGTVSKYMGMIDIMDDASALKDFMQIEKWIYDSPDHVGETFRQFLKDFAQQNKWVDGTLEIGHDVIDLQKITMPVLNIYAEKDHLVPPASSKALGGLIASDDYSELPFDGGHIGPFVSSRAQKIIPPAISEWLDSK